MLLLETRRHFGEIGIGNFHQRLRDHSHDFHVGHEAGPFRTGLIIEQVPTVMPDRGTDRSHVEPDLRDGTISRVRLRCGQSLASDARVRRQEACRNN